MEEIYIKTPVYGVVTLIWRLSGFCVLLISSSVLVSVFQLRNKHDW